MLVRHPAWPLIDGAAGHFIRLKSFKTCSPTFSMGRSPPTLPTKQHDSNMTVAEIDCYMTATLTVRLPDSHYNSHVNQLSPQ